MPTPLRAVGGMGGMEIEMLPIINVGGTSLPVPRSEAAVSNRTIGMQPVLSMKGLGDIYGMDESGDVIVVRHSTATESFLGAANSTLAMMSETKTVTRKTKTATAEKAKETDDRVVHLGLFVALLGVLSIVV